MSIISSHLRNKLKLILFDLDGTLLDSSTGIFNAIRYAFIAHNLQVAFEEQTLLKHAGRGVEFLFKEINGKLTKDELISLKETAFWHYQTHAQDTTESYPNVRELFETLQKKAIKWGVVTSKTRVLTEAVLPKLPLFESAAIVVCADDLTYKKPHPMPLLYAMQKLNVSHRCTAYVGDAKTDMCAAKYAGCYRIFANYGYEAVKLTVQEYDLKISNVEQLITWITYMNA
ncbi:HAD family hydrolase [Fastidiosibacter lacustris]|uniref:HAD family hydrolase n=1 Tax=Fastidiosibacter lacustris TaxID=2056695 RepID=UPI001300A8E6|nr:HAD family hydrolase [Fastidiosibacter lacustris]